MKKLLLMLLVMGCVSLPQGSVGRDPQVTIAVHNNSFYDIVVYVDGKRKTSVTSNRTECIVLWYIPFQAELSFSPIGENMHYFVPSINLISQKHWSWDIINNFSLSANVGLTPASTKCEK